METFLTVALGVAAGIAAVPFMFLIFLLAVGIVILILSAIVFCGMLLFFKFFGR